MNLDNMPALRIGALEAKIPIIQGGRGVRQRLLSLGLQEGQRLRKLSALALGGPVIVMVNRAQVAIGRGIARRIVMEGRGHRHGPQV